MSESTHTHAAHQHAAKNPFLIPFLWILIFTIIELIGGVWTNSLALIGDAGHMATDTIALGLAMLANWRAVHHTSKNISPPRFDVEKWVAVLNAGLMLIVVVWIVFESLQRLKAPQAINGGYVAVLAFLGLIVNVIVARQLHQQEHHHSESSQLNHRAALLHVIGDLLGSVAALIAGIVVYFTGWYLIDPILSLLISALILFATVSLIRDIMRASRKQKSVENL